MRYRPAKSVPLTKRLGRVAGAVRLAGETGDSRRRAGVGDGEARRGGVPVRVAYDSTAVPQPGHMLIDSAIGSAHDGH
jgi:hypothetical protein